MPRVSVKRIILLRGGVVGDDVTPPEYSSGAHGNVFDNTANVILVVQFNEAVESATGFENGVTVRYNAVSQTVSSGSQPGSLAEVQYVIAAPADVNDVIDWAYDDNFGDIQDTSGNDLLDVSAQTAVNHVGSHAWFDNEEDSAHLAWV